MPAHLVLQPRRHCWAIVTACREVGEDFGYQFLLKEGDGGRILGRTNLSGIRRANFQSIALAYRIAESARGRD
jgi:RimJ/RimL family protein N-acetyltransferase